MPEKRTIERARHAARRGRAPSTQAGEFVREEIEHIRKGKHGVRSAKQVIAIGLSKARRAGVRLPPPSARPTSKRTRRKAQRDLYRRGTPARFARRSRAVTRVLKHSGGMAASSLALSRQARSAARRRSAAQRSAAARKAARTKGPRARAKSARKAARTRARRA